MTEAQGNDLSGYMYIGTNAGSANGIVVLGRHQDGTLTELKGSPYSTGARGEALAGDFDTQWAVRIVGDYLLTINAGHNPINGSISVFRVNRDNGTLTQIDQNPATPAMDNIDSHGIRPASIATTSAEGVTWVVIGNQHSNPLYLDNKPALTSPVEASSLRNLAVFDLDPATGIMKFRSIGATYDSGKYGGPVTVEFNPGGDKLSVVTFGVPDVQAHPRPKLQVPGRLYIYSFKRGNLKQTGLYEETGVSGNTGSSWSPNGQYVYVTNANAVLQDHDLTVHDGVTAAKVQHFATGSDNDQKDEVCWSLVSLDGKRLYTASTGTNEITVFDIGDDGRLSKSLKNNVFPLNEITGEDAKDMYETPGRLYVMAALRSHSVVAFRTAADGRLTQVGPPYRIPSLASAKAAIAGGEGEVGLEGMTGFERSSSTAKP
ncbi:hypothetical protein KX816_18430 [Sphingosinicellaceae bacterium]|nr:hypothetical protein KX816_18430 [Sphingosinicellaceae bacterium]